MTNKERVAMSIWAIILTVAKHLVALGIIGGVMVASLRILALVYHDDIRAFLRLDLLEHASETMQAAYARQEQQMETILRRLELLDGQIQLLNPDRAIEYKPLSARITRECRLNTTCSYTYEARRTEAGLECDPPQWVGIVVNGGGTTHRVPIDYGQVVLGPQFYRINGTFKLDDPTILPGEAYFYVELLFRGCLGKKIHRETSEEQRFTILPDRS